MREREKNMRIFIYEKKYISKKDGNKFPVLKGILRKEDTKTNTDHYFNIGFYKEDKELFNKEMLKKDLSFPITIDLKPNDYFISKKYDKEKKIEILTLVIKNWSDMQQEGWKSNTLEDFAKQNDKLPF